MTIEQTVEVPASRRVTFDLPFTFPIGTARAALVVYPEHPAKLPPEGNSTPMERSRPIQAGAEQPTPLTDRLSGILSHIGDISPDELRTERLSKYLK
ncbi:hypothetical protein AGMMS49991_05560 [Spirochaetia bacterium]|nr:hypothetical protein AGMMS49991_05560 [Spirochaetia bacterium]